MQAYANLSGNSGVASYELGDGQLTVLFKNGWHYLYTEASTGAQHIAQMHVLAKAGKGLSAYISQHVKKLFAKKWQ